VDLASPISPIDAESSAVADATVWIILGDGVRCTIHASGSGGGILGALKQFRHDAGRTLSVKRDSTTEPTAASNSSATRHNMLRRSILVCASASL